MMTKGKFTIAPNERWRMYSGRVGPIRVDADNAGQVLLDLYLAHLNGDMGSMDDRWLTVRKILQTVAAREVTKFTASRDFHGLPLREKIEDVCGSLQAKFIAKKLSNPPPPTADRFMGFIKVTAVNDLRSAFRKSQSPCTLSLHEQSHANGRLAKNVSKNDDTNGDQADSFGRIRGWMDPFRIPNVLYIREAILAYFLSSGEYPGPNFLSGFGVKKPNQRLVYNIAIVDINRAICRCMA